MKKINFLLTISDFVISDGFVLPYSGSKQLYKQVEIDVLINDKNALDALICSSYNKVEKLIDYNLLIFKQEAISIAYLKERKNKGDTTVMLHKNIDNKDISAFYKFEVWLEIKGVRVSPGQYIQAVDYPDDVAITFPEKKHWHLGRKQIPAPMEPRWTAHLVPKKDIDKIIGIKRYKDINWLGTEKENDFTGETEEIVLEMGNFNEKNYDFFKQHEAFEIVWQ